MYKKKENYIAIDIFPFVLGGLETSAADPNLFVSLKWFRSGLVLPWK